MDSEGWHQRFSSSSRVSAEQVRAGTPVHMACGSAGGGVRAGERAVGQGQER